MPLLILSTDGDDVDTRISEALAHGIRAFDIAAVNGNAAVIGNALAKARCGREELFVIFKVWIRQEGRICLWED
jgi:diketogulonate reductase-like aldo/keto reductase